VSEGARREDERGIVMVWFGLVLVVLLGVAAFAVDLVHAYAEAQHLQNAADAAALAGAVQLPAGSGPARDRACALLQDNFKGSDPCDDLPANRFPLVDIHRDAVVQNQMDVEAKVRVKTFFAQVLGFDHIDVRKSAQAQYDPPLAMGSPANNYGDIPDGTCPDGSPTGVLCASTPTNAQQSLWAQVMGAGTTKANGNSFTTTLCSGGTDGCSGSTNNDYKDETPDQRFSIVQDAADHAPINVYVYDAGYVDVGVRPDPPPGTGIVRTCTVPWLDAGGNPPATANGKHYITDPGPGFPVQPRNPSCAGDTNLSPGLHDDQFDTTYTVYRNDKTPSPFDNDQQYGTCSRTIKPISASSGTTWDPTNPEAQYFQNWVNVCTISDGGVKGTEWILSVGAPNAAATGVNNFSVMALHDSTDDAKHVGEPQVMSRSRMPLFTDKAGAAPGSSTFYLARVLPSTGRVRKLQVSFFDFGDTQGGLSATGDLTVKAKNGSNFPNGVKNCEVTSPITGFSTASEFGPSTDPPAAAWGDMAAEPDCKFKYNASWNRQWVSLNVEIPANYNCDTDDPTDCWVQLEVNPDAANNVLFDATTWTARMLGSPVRLVK
jgi:hypothetical protein